MVEKNKWTSITVIKWKKKYRKITIDPILKFGIPYVSERERERVPQNLGIPLCYHHNHD